MRRRHLGILSAVLPLIALAGGCGGTTPPPATAPVAGYEGAGPELSGLDLAPLQGRRILLDPGHGGRFRGALGPGGLAEAEVNLGVALYLRGLLEWAGATVFMTRGADVDLCTPIDSTLTGDLARRVALADSLRPDVFVSIHHNSNAARDPILNETQTYYPAGREGADLDLARAVHKHMVRALGITPARIMAGGFYVLRNAPVPAVLGEPAMLSNPVIEGRLTLARSHEIEARAYFRGLLEYFAGGVPQWTTSVPDTFDMRRMPYPQREMGQILSWTFTPGRPGDPPLDPASIEVLADGEPAIWSLDATGTVVTLPLPRALPREITLQARNLAGKTTPRRRHILTGRAPYAGISSAFIHDGADRDHGPLLVVYESPTVDLAERATLWLANDRMPESQWIRLPVFPGRRGWALVPPAPFRADDAHIVERRVSGDLTTVGRHPAGNLGRWGLRSSRWRPLALTPGVWPDSNVPGPGWRLRWPALADTLAQQAQARGLVIDPTAPVIPDDPRAPLWLEADGAFPLFTDASGHTPWQDAHAAAPDTLVWAPLLPALVGKRVVLDPRGGGTDEQGRGPGGTRGSDLNLQVAQRLAALLRGVGCVVTVTRTAESWVPDEVKVQRANDDGAELYLAIARGEPGAGTTARHHPGSTVGNTLARQLAGAWRGGMTIAEGTEYVLRHTACPALVVELPAVTTDEDALADPRVQDQQARALLLALAATWQGTTVLADAAALPAVMASFADPRAVDWARWDGNLVWLAPYRSVSLADDTPLPARGDRHFLELHLGGNWQLWAVTRTGTRWTGALLLCGP